MNKMIWANWDSGLYGVGIGWRFFGVQATDEFVGLMVGFIMIGVVEFDGWWLPIVAPCK